MDPYRPTLYPYIPPILPNSESNLSSYLSPYIGGYQSLGIQGVTPAVNPPPAHMGMHATQHSMWAERQFSNTDVQG